MFGQVLNQFTFYPTLFQTNNEIGLLVNASISESL